MRLKNDMVTLRPITVKDAPRFVKWLANKEVSKPLRGSHTRVTLKQELEWIKGLKKKKKTDKQFAVMQLLKRYGFRDLKLHKIELAVYEFNKRGIKLYKKMGCKIEGVRKEHLFYGKKYYDEILMGLFADREYEILLMN